MADLLTQAAYAKRRGVKRQYINRLVKQGIIKLKKGKVDPAQADRAISGYADPARSEFRKSPGPAATQEPERDSTAYWRKAELQVRTALKKLDHDERVGKLVDAEKIERELVNLLTAIKTRIRAIAPKCAQEVAHLKVAKKKRRSLITEVQEILRKEHDEALEELGRWKHTK